MNYEFIEKLVSDAKIGDLNAKETLIIEFTPFINSISRRFFIHGYERCDIKNECFLTLCNCIYKYKLDTHRFVAYATNSIKNNLNILVTRIVKRNNFDGLFSLSGDIDNTVSLNHLIEHENKSLEYEHDQLFSAIKNNLSDSERHLVLFVFFKKNTLTNYAYYENISYVTASKRKKKVLEKLKTLILFQGGNELWELTI